MEKVDKKLRDKGLATDFVPYLQCTIRPENGKDKQNLSVCCRPLSRRRDELQKRITDMSAFLQEQPTALVQYNESLVRRLIEKVTVYEDKFTVEFKSGLKVDVNE